MNRQEENADMIKKISGSRTGDFEDGLIFLLGTVTTVLMDISKSLAIIADNTKKEKEE